MPADVIRKLLAAHFQPSGQANGRRCQSAKKLRKWVHAQDPKKTTTGALYSETPMPVSKSIEAASTSSKARPEARAAGDSDVGLHGALIFDGQMRQMARAVKPHGRAVSSGRYGGKWALPHVPPRDWVYVKIVLAFHVLSWLN